MEPKRERANRNQLARKILFALGSTVMTPGAINALEPNELLTFLSRHSRGDWGEVCEEDWNENDYSVKNGLRILSAYTTRQGDKIWIVTEADRSVTTVLLPEEY